MKFSAFGDWGYNTSHRKNISKTLRTKGIDFNILLGDNFYPKGVCDEDDVQFDKFEEDFGFVKNSVILGNHDWLQNMDAQILYTAKSKTWSMPFFFYDFYCEGVHFIMLDTCSLAIETTRRLTEIMGKSFGTIKNRLIDLREKQLAWLTDILENSVGKIKIVCGHYPIFSNGNHGNNIEMIKNVLPILCKNNVDMYLSGHDHSMQHIKKYNIDFYVLGSGSEATLIGDNQQGTKNVRRMCGFGLFTKKGEYLETEFVDEHGKSHVYNLYFKK